MINNQYNYLDKVKEKIFTKKEKIPNLSEEITTERTKWKSITGKYYYNIRNLKFMEWV